MMSKEMKQTLTELLTGIWVWTALLIALFLLVQHILGRWEAVRLSICLGLVCGGILASFMAVHMAKSIDTAVELGEDGALSHTRKMYVIRTAIVCVCVVALYYTGVVHILGIFAGLFGLKPAAYFQPVLHRILTGHWASEGEAEQAYTPEEMESE
jgi:hypothetical protein